MIVTCTDRGGVSTAVCLLYGEELGALVLILDRFSITQGYAYTNSR